MARRGTTFTDTEFLKTARARFKFADESDSKQQQRERDDLAFYAGDQWPADYKLARQGQQPINGMAAVPSRPTLVINNVREPIRQISNDAIGADLGVEITPAEDFGDLGVIPDDTEIKLREGLVRKIQRESQARDARMWAFDRAVKAGRGYYQVLVRFLPGKTWDQEVYVHRIYNQAAVLLDPSHEEPDGSDAKWGFICVDMLWDDYKARFPTAAGKKNRLASALSDTEWQVLGDDYPKWFKSADENGAGKDQKTRAVRVVDYFYTEHETRELSILEDGSTVWTDELPEELPEGTKVIDTRDVVESQIKWAKIDGAQTLEQMDWEGPDMPIVKVLGEELQPYDGERRAEGMVRPARDSQMGLNYMISKQVEMVGLTPLTPLIGDPDATEGFPEWDLLNTRVVPMARYRSYDDQGRPLKEPHRPNADPNLLPISQSIALFSAQIEKTTAVPAARLGDIDPVTRSGKALDRLTANSKNSTSNFLQNLLRSVRYEGQIENNLLFPIYGARPGRLVRVMTGEGTSQMVMVHDAPEDARKDQQLAALIQKAESVAKLTPDAKFNINIKVTRDFDTRRQEEHAVIGEMIAAAPSLMNVIGDLFFATMDSPGHDEMAKRLRVTLAPPVQQLLAAEEQGQAPPSPRELQLQAENAQLKQVAQKMGMDLQSDALAQRTKIQTTQMSEAAETDRTRMQEQNENYRAALERETKLAVAEISAQAKQALTSLQLFYEERARLGGQQHDANQADVDRSHEAALEAAGADHDAEQTQLGQQHEASMAAMQSQPPMADEASI